MKTLANLKVRLESLPDIRVGRQHEALYAKFLDASIAVADKLAKAKGAVEYAAPIIPSEASKEVSSMIRTACGIASRLKKKLTADPGGVADSKVDASFIRLCKNADAALRTCESAWEFQLRERIKDWQVIGEVVAKMAEKQEANSIKPQTDKLKTAIKSLDTVKTKLPQNEQDASKVQSDLNDLNDSVTKLRLNTPFGKFLQDAASPQGASLDAAQMSEISEKIAELDLGKVFRVRFSS